MKKHRSFHPGAGMAAVLLAAAVAVSGCASTASTSGNSSTSGAPSVQENTAEKESSASVTENEASSEESASDSASDSDTSLSVDSSSGTSSSGTSEGSASSDASSSDASSESSTSETTSVSEEKDGDKTEASEGSGEIAAVVPVEKTGYTDKKYTEKTLLAEMQEYWASDNEQAVEDLALLARYKQMSASLSGAEYYYSGERNAAGQPEGTGLAAYAGNQYYYGGWKAGKKDGQGIWLRVYVSAKDNPGVLAADPSVTVHSYRGGFSNDLPCGDGQEQFIRDTSAMEQDGLYIMNIMGNFTDGLYDGNMYIMTEGGNGTDEEWNGTAKAGVFETFDGRDSLRRVPICTNVKNEDSHIWVKATGNREMGITELRYIAGVTLSDTEKGKKPGQSLGK